MKRVLTFESHNTNTKLPAGPLLLERLFINISETTSTNHSQWIHPSNMSNPENQPCASTSPLLALPRIVRFRIWRLILLTDKEIVVNDGIEHKEPALLFVCRQLNAEASIVYCMENEFVCYVDEDGNAVSFDSDDEEQLDNTEESSVGVGGTEGGAG